MEQGNFRASLRTSLRRVPAAGSLGEAQTTPHINHRIEKNADFVSGDPTIPLPSTKILPQLPYAPQPSSRLLSFNTRIVRYSSGSAEGDGGPGVLPSKPR